jgi:hypothetical protein
VEVDTLADTDRELAFDGIDFKLVFDLAALEADVADGAIDPIHLGIRARVNEPVNIGPLAAVLIPVRQEPVPALLELRRPMEMVVFDVSAQPLRHPALREVLGSLALQVGLLASDLGDDDASVLLFEFSENAAALGRCPAAGRRQQAPISRPFSAAWRTRRA